VGKARQLGLLIRRKDFLLRAGAIFAGFLGLVSGALDIAGWHLNLGFALGFLAAALVCAGLIARRETVPDLLSVPDILERDFDKDAKPHIICPCDLKLSAQARELAHECFTGNSTITPDVFEQLRVKNPFILACLVDGMGELLGYFDVIPIRETFARAFLKGLVGEEQMTHEDVLPPDTMQSCEYLYLSGIAVKDAGTHGGRRNANIMVWAFLRYLEHFYGSSKATAFAVAVTKAGDDLLHRFRLHQEASAASRKDKYKLYSIEMSREEIERRLDCLPDWSHLCALPWAETGSSDRHKIGRVVHLPKDRAWRLRERSLAAASR
jgi:hypothetical protein